MKGTAAYSSNFQMKVPHGSTLEVLVRLVWDLFRQWTETEGTFDWTRDKKCKMQIYASMVSFARLLADGMIDAPTLERPSSRTIHPVIFVPPHHQLQPVHVPQHQLQQTKPPQME